MTEALRTPDDRFEGLPGFRFAPRYVDDLAGYEGLRMHYLDEGPRDGHVFFCPHGQPTWSYLYRKILPALAAAGHRVVAPDLYGFGRSDKPVDDAVYTFDFHRGSLLALVERLGLEGATLVAQDWGGILGLTLLPDSEGVFTSLLLMNTALPTGQVSEGFLAWRKWAREHPDMEIGKLMARACPQLTPAESAAYDAPFPDVRYKAGVRRFPELVPDSPQAPGADHGLRTLAWLRGNWKGESRMVVGAEDPVLGPQVMRPLAAVIPGCPPPVELPGVGHFVQEAGEPVVRAALELVG